ncbi:MAG: hypothetical protein V3U68_03635 [Bacteroidota bacterium]
MGKFPLASLAARPVSLSASRGLDAAQRHRTKRDGLIEDWRMSIGGSRDSAIGRILTFDDPERD